MIHEAPGSRSSIRAGGAHHNSQNGSRVQVLAWPYLRNGAENAYQAEVYGPLGDQVSFIEYTPLRSLLSRADIFHYHWPETYLNDACTLKALVGTGLFGLRVLGTTLAGGRNIWTVHNSQPHEHHHPFIERMFYRWLVRQTDEFIFLSDQSRESFLKHWALPTNARVEVIPHPFYRRNSVAQGLPTSSRPAGDYFLTFGQVRPYKNIPSAIQAIQDCRDLPSGVRYRVIGRTSLKQLAQKIDSMIRAGDRVEFENRFLEGSELEQLVANCLGVVLPYSAVSNSGAAYYALSSGVPVLCPKIGAFAELQERYPDYVHTYSGELGPDDIRAFYERCVRFNRRGCPPVNVAEENARIAAAHGRVFARR